MSLHARCSVSRPRSLLLFLPLSLALQSSLSATATAQDFRPFVRGDSNADGLVDLSDTVDMVTYTFLDGAAPRCLKAADVNGDSHAAGIADAVHSLFYVFLGGPPPVAPFPTCGIDDDDTLGCESYPPCGDDGLPIDPREIRPVEEDAFAAIPQPSLEWIGETVRVGDLFQVELSDFGPVAPGSIDWGDGAATPVAEDGLYGHVYTGERDATIWLIDRNGDIHFEAAILVTPMLSVEGIVIEPLPAAPGSGAALPPELGGDPCGAPLPPHWEEARQQCRQFAIGGEGPVLAATFQTRGTGVLHVDVSVEKADGLEQTVQSFDLEQTNEGGALRIEVGPLPVDSVGITRAWFDLSAVTAAGSAGIASVWFGYQVIAPASLEEECWQLRFFHRVLSGVLATVKDDCDRLRRELERAQQDRDRAQDDLQKAQQRLADLEAERDALQEDADDDRRDIESWLGDTGTLENSSDVGADENFVGAHGVGIAFDDAAALLERSDAVEEATGTNLLAMVNEYAQKQKKLASLNQRVARAQANVQAHEARVQHLETKIADLQAQLADCEAKARQLEEELEDLELRERLCLERLALKRRLEEAIRALRGDARSIRGGVEDAQGAAGEAEEAIDRSPGTPGQHEADYRTAETGAEAADQASNKLDTARSKLQAAQEAIEAEDLERAEQLVEEAADAVELARRCLRQAEEFIDEALKSATSRECTDGDRRLGERREFQVWTKILGYALTPGGLKPGEWEGIVNRGQERLDGLIVFIKWANALIDIADALITGAPFVGTFTPDPEKAAQIIFDAYATRFQGVAGLDLHVLLEGCAKYEQVVCDCIESKWQYRKEEGILKKPDYGDYSIGWVTSENAVAEIEKLMDKHAKEFAARGAACGQ